ARAGPRCSCRYGSLSSSQASWVHLGSAVTTTALAIAHLCEQLGQQLGAGRPLVAGGNGLGGRALGVQVIAVLQRHVAVLEGADLLSIRAVLLLDVEHAANEGPLAPVLDGIRERRG